MNLTHNTTQEILVEIMPLGKCLRFPFLDGRQLVFWVVCELGGRHHILSVSVWYSELTVHHHSHVLDALSIG